jgi:hypothetical protein
MRRLGIVFVVAFCAVLGAMASCKQGEGERCQVEADCESGLQCNAATGTCQLTGAAPDGVIAPDARVDGGTQADAALPDAELPDAM